MKSEPSPEFSNIERLSSHSHSHSHSHGHPHSHGHSHSHEEGHEHPPLPPPRPSAHPPLTDGAGQGKVLLLDTPSGIAGDMTIAALLDLGVPVEVVTEAVRAVAVTGYRLDVRSARAGAIGGSRFNVELNAPQPARAYAEIERLLAGAALSEPVRALAQRIFSRLAHAESEVHRIPLAEVEFHEVGAVDAIVDIVGAAACFCFLGARVVATPVPLGRGFVDCQHGRLPLPAPATVLCLAGVPTYDSGLSLELVTPTGAAILATVASEFVEWPSFAPERVGFGIGRKELADRPNALRAILGADRATAQASSHVVLQANVDDMTGELAAYAIDALLRAGALDAWAEPVTMKKGRPGLVLSALAAAPLAESLSEVMLRETSSIGVRRLLASRVERPRRQLVVETRFGSVAVKVSEGAYGPALAKPEFDACAALARSANVPVREVIAAALAAYDALER
jgi:uncharacterized protein (TIGR00299 family) protein